MCVVVAVFYSSGTKYFGYTQNNTGDWINTTDDKTLYFHILPEDTIESSWSGKLKVKADLNSSYYGGPGEYNFKIGRYTSAKSSASWSSDIATISIIAPTPTPTEETTPTSTLTSTPTPTSTPALIPTSTPEVSHTYTPTPSPQVLSATTESSPYSVFFQESTVSASSSSPSATTKSKLGVNLTFVGFGLVVLSGSILFFRNNPY